MEIKIKDTKENVLLNRTEINAEINHQGEPTPSRNQIRDKLAAMLSADKNLLVITKMSQSFSTVIKCSAMIYKSKADMEATEQKHLLKRDAGEAKGAEEAVPEAKPEEKK